MLKPNSRGSIPSIALDTFRPAQIYGIRYGLRGFYSRGAKPLELNYHAVEGIHLRGGTILVGGCCQLHWVPNCCCLPPAVLGGCGSS